MCLIINRPSGRTIPAHYLKNAALRNPDGWGIMWAQQGKIVTSRGMKPGKLASAIDRAPAGNLSVHLRYATHGTRGVENCHPFTFSNGRYALMHNGIIASVPTVDKTRSDTWHFAHHVLEPMLNTAPELFDSPKFAPILGAMIGEGNKLVILRADGAEVIVNRHIGEEDKTGLWLSNTYSIASPLPPAITFQSARTWPKMAPTRAVNDDWAYSESKPFNGSARSWRDDDYLPETIETEEETRPEAPHHAYDIWDCQDLERDDLIDLCQNDPETVADIIIDALADLRQMGF